MVTKIIKHVNGNKGDISAKYHYTLYVAPLKLRVKVPKFIGDIYFSK